MKEFFGFQENFLDGFKANSIFLFNTESMNSNPDINLLNNFNSFPFVYQGEN